jgi:hypothetical protein
MRDSQAMMVKTTEMASFGPTWKYGRRCAEQKIGPVNPGENAVIF